MSKILDENGLLYLWGKIKALVLSNKTTVDATLGPTSENPVQNKAIYSALDGKVDKVSGKGLSTEDYTTAEKTKLSNITETYTAFSGKPTGNQSPTFGGTFTIQQISQDTTGQVSGTDRTVTIPSNTASASANGLMSSSDYSKLSALLQTLHFKRHTLQNQKLQVCINIKAV